VDASDDQVGCRDDEASPSDRESDINDDDGSTQAESKIPRIEDDPENTFMVRELLPDDDRTLLARSKSYSTRRKHRMEFSPKVDENELLRALEQAGTHPKTRVQSFLHQARSRNTS
jgi:hypothetical protein